MQATVPVQTNDTPIQQKVESLESKKTGMACAV